MNLTAILHWAALILWLLAGTDEKQLVAEAEGRAGITKNMNEQGLFRGTTEALRAYMDETSSPMATNVKQRLLEFTQESEKRSERRTTFPDQHGDIGGRSGGLLGDRQVIVVVPV